MARIAFLLPDFAMGGAERVVLALIHAFVRRGIAIDLVLLRAEGELLSDLPREVQVVPLGATRLRGALRPFIRYLRDRRPDVVHARMWPMTLVPILARAFVRPRPRLVIAEDSILSRAYADRGLLHRTLLRSSIGLLYPLADARIAVANGAADDLSELGRIDRRAITVLHNPVTLPNARSEMSPPEWGEGARILAVGNLIPVKNFQLLLSAFAEFAKLRPAKLVILGDGRERNELEELAAGLGIAESVSMPGLVDNPSPYYMSADALVLTSRNEAFPGVLIEALHHGLTVASTDCPRGPREILDGGRFGYLTPNGEANALAEAMIEACDHPFPSDVLKTRAIELSGPHVIDRYLELLLPGRLPHDRSELSLEAK